MNAPTLHAVDPDEAEVLEARARALVRFAARYRHNPESQRAMVGGLNRLARTFSQGELDVRSFPWELLVDNDLTQTMWSSVAAHYSRNTAVRDASSLRILLKCLWREQLLSYEEYRRAIDFEAKGGTARPPAGHYLDEQDIHAIAEACLAGPGQFPTRVRDLALLLTLASSGARGHEVSHMTMENVHLNERRIWLTVTKGSAPRNAILHPAAVEALEGWLTVRGTEPGPLFVPLSRTGRPMLDHGQLSTHQIWKIVHRRAADAGYPGITPHDLRRFVISNLLEHHDTVLVAGIVGHQDPSTTAGYDRRPLRAQRAAVETLTLPRLSDLMSKVSDNAHQGARGRDEI